MSERGTIFLFSNTVPIEHSGSFIIFRRHLLPLVDAGWKLKIFSYFPAPSHGLFWEHIRLVHRLSWWPPASTRFLWLQKLRTKLAVHHLRRTGALECKGPRVLLANLWDSQGLFAAELARARFGRLGLFFHDDEIAFGERSLPRRYLDWARADMTNAADRIWAVSTRLIKQLPARLQERCRVLRPIPAAQASRAVWRPRFGESVHLGYAGKTYPGLERTLSQLAEQLTRVGGKLTVITDPRFVERPPVSSAAIQWKGFLPRPEDAAAWIRENCSAVLVAHPAGVAGLEGGWQMLQSSFPSKLTEYAQLGLPIVAHGDHDSELGDWAQKHPSIPFFTDAAASDLGNYLAQLRHETGWRSAAAAAVQLAADEFDPVQMQHAFATDLHALARPS